MRTLLVGPGGEPLVTEVTEEDRTRAVLVECWGVFVGMQARAREWKTQDDAQQTMATLAGTIFELVGSAPLEARWPGLRIQPTVAEAPAHPSGLAVVAQ